ncbi:MAG: fatty acid desaturase, partial [Actinobacteria bacterium]|nr:fatty acid desaturase [Actinomycetota bacterium]
MSIPTPTFEGVALTVTDARPTADPVAPGSPDAAEAQDYGTSTKRRPGWEQALVYVVVGLPVVGLIVGVVLAAMFGGISGTDVGIAFLFYLISGFGVTVGFHRLFTHQSFQTNRPLKIALAIAGSLALEGPVIRWVADHRKHHAFSDDEGDPHSPWRFGDSPRALFKGLLWAHTGWLFDREQTSARRWAPDLIADPDLRKINKLFPVIALSSLLAPTLMGYALTGTAMGAFTAYIWGGLVRILVVHHVTWSVNSLCHVIGERPYKTMDQASNVSWLAIVSFGESWHNLHHADPKCARHGVEKRQIDTSAAVIELFEKAGWATNVRWPTEKRMA